jgi:hypothetical protein
MATKDKTVIKIDSYRESMRIVTWVNLQGSDDGDPVELGCSSDKTIQFEGTFGDGGIIIMEGSNDGSNWRVLTDPQGNNISKTTPGIETIVELTRYIRPRVPAGDGTTNLTACLLLKASK